MNVLFPIRKKFSDLIFSGEKDLEFRKSNIKVKPGELCFVYETKGGIPGGCGKVVGFFECNGVNEIPYYKVGTYAMLEHFVQRAINEPDVLKKYIDINEYEGYLDTIKRAMAIRFKSTDESYVLNFLCNQHAVEIMEKSREPLGMSGMMDLLKDYKQFSKLENLSIRLCDKCDEWLSNIGYYGDDDKSYWSYSISIKNPYRIEPIDITQISLSDNRMLKSAPQSFCYINIPDYRIRR